VYVFFFYINFGFSVLLGGGRAGGGGGGSVVVWVWFGFVVGLIYFICF
jgi:hypothetical protein